MYREDRKEINSTCQTNTHYGDEIMKTNLKALVAAVALCAAGGANAAIDLGSTGFGDNSELFLSAWDPVAQVSYVRDLGIHFEDFLATGQNSSNNWQGSDNSGWSVFGANTSNVRWNVVGINAFTSDGSNYLTYGYMTTTNDTAANIESTTNSNFPTAFDNPIGNAKNFIASVNGSDTTASDNNTTTSAVIGAPDNASNQYWGNNFGNSTGYTNDTGLGSSMAFYQVAYNANTDGVVANQLAGLFSLASDGTLTYTVGGVPTVPVPPALWLLGSALVGLVGVSRRKREATDEGLMA